MAIEVFRGVGYARGVLFERRLQRGLVDGSIRVAFRRWRQPQVVGGRRYRSPIGMVAVDKISQVDGEITLEDARAAGYASVAELLADLQGPADSRLYRLELRATSEADPRQQLAADGLLTQSDVQQLQARLARLDRENSWTINTLHAIGRHPGTRAADIYAELGWPDLATFKAHVRKLKALGLTISLRVGYQLSPRGEAYLRALAGGSTVSQSLLTLTTISP
jgi:hypothetical protein